MLYYIQQCLKLIKPKHDDDIIGRLNHRFTASFLAISIVFITAKQYAGRPLQCWMPPEFMDHWENFIETYCYLENTYFVSHQELYLPESSKDREISYYQWVPIVLCIQLFLFLLPRIIWSEIISTYNLNVADLVAIYGDSKEKKDQKPSQIVAEKFQKFIAFNNREGVPKKTSFLTFVYLAYKALNCLNVIGQLFFINHFFNTAYHLWGFGVIRDVMNQYTWHTSARFPRVTYCDVNRRDELNGKPMEFTVQCLLMINMLYEKLFILLWVWFTILSVLNVYSFLRWVYKSFWKASQKKFIAAHLDKSDHRHIDQFLATSMSSDIITTLRLMSCHLEPMNFGDLIKELFARSQAENDSTSVSTALTASPLLKDIEQAYEVMKV